MSLAPYPVICKKYGIIFFPIPKVACSSLLIYVADILNIQKDNVKTIHSAAFPNIQLNETISHNFHKVAIVRNPYDRIVSFYNNKILSKTQISLVTHLGFKHNMSFESCVKLVCRISDERAEPHFVSQHKFITLENKIVVDTIIKLENIRHEFPTFLKSHNLPNLEFTHANKAKEKKQSNALSKDLKELIFNRYEKDFKLFKYEK